MKPLDRILLAHGGGGALSGALIKELFLPAFDNPALATLSDAAVLSLPPGPFAFTTDSYVVTPRFFPGGDIGTLAIAGTVNDLAVSGAVPRFLSCSMILEEGLPLDDLRRVVDSMARTAAEAGVQVVTGDTKVVERGEADGIFITTAGVGELRPLPEGWGTPLPGDHVLINGPVGDHGFAVLAAREGLMFETRLQSDCAPLNALIDTLFDPALHIRFMRDATRGGLAAVLNELAAGHDWGVALRAGAIPVSPSVRSLSEILGIDPLFVANEGKVVMVVSPADTSAALESMRSHPLGREATVIGTIECGLHGLVTIDTDLGGRRILDMPLGEQLPRIC